MIKYIHIERLGTDEVDGILNGTVYIQPKLDGANGQIYFDTDGIINCASRKQILSEEKTNQGFWNYISIPENHKILLNYFDKHPYHILYGEWLVPHTLKTYRKDSWKKFYVFDVLDSYSGLFLNYDKYVEELKEFGIPFIPVIAKIYNAKEEDLLRFLDQNLYLIEDGKGTGEGIVIKNYDFVNKYGRTTWAKLVRNEFKEQHIVEMGYSESNLEPIELKIAREFVTDGRLNKIKHKILEEKETNWSSKYIMEYLERTYYDVITEESWTIIKKYKNPIINFNAFHKFIIQIIKETDKEIF